MTDVLAAGVDGFTCWLPANGHIPGRVELLGKVGTAALGRLSVSRLELPRSIGTRRIRV